MQYKHLGQVHNQKILRPTRKTLLQLEERTNNTRKPMVVHLSLPSITNAIQTPRTSTQSKDTKTYKKKFTPTGGKNKQYKKTNGCPPLTTIQEVDAEVERESQIDLDISETEAEDICSIMNDITDEENIPTDSETEM